MYFLLILPFYPHVSNDKNWKWIKRSVKKKWIKLALPTQHSCQGRNHDDLQVIYERILSHGKVYVSQLIEPQRCTADDVLEYALKQIYKSMGAATVARLFESNAQHQKHIRNINDTVDRLLKEKRATHNIEGSSTNDFSVYEKKLCQNCVYWSRVWYDKCHKRKLFDRSPFQKLLFSLDWQCS